MSSSKRPRANALSDFQIAFTRHLRDPKHSVPPTGLGPRARIRLYGDLILNDIDVHLSACFPIARAVIGKRAWKTLVQDFVKYHDCATPYFHEIPDELIRYLETERGHRENDAPFLKELMHYEWSELVLSVSGDPAPRALHVNGALAEGIPVLNPILAITDYHYPVHLIGKRVKPDLAPRPTYILGFRDAAYQVRFLSLNNVTMRLMAILMDERLSGYDAVQKTVRDLALPDPDTAIAGGLVTLQNLRNEGVILGASQGFL